MSPEMKLNEGQVFCWNLIQNFVQLCISISVETVGRIEHKRVQIRILPLNPGRSGDGEDFDFE
jgi:hypothetical protein